MKKLLTLILALVMLLALVGCSYLPEDLQAQINGVISGIMGGEGTPDDGGETPNEPEHVHDFVQTEKKKAYCGKDGWAKYECSTCGETKEEVIPKLGHDIQYYSTTNPTCLKTGAITHKCTRCSTTEVTTLPALGHEWGETTEPSRIVCCTREGCNKTQMPETNGKYAEVLESDAAVYISGNISTEEGEAPRILLSTASALIPDSEYVKKAKTEEIKIYIKIPDLSDSRINNIKRIAALNRGNAKIVLYDSSRAKYCVLKDALVDPSDKVMTRLAATFGADNVILK
jgi:hypothetical protein